MNSILPFLLLGVIAGILSGLLGVGSGLLLVPALAIVFAMPQKSAQAISLAIMVPMALMGATRYIMNPAIKVDLRVAALIALGAVAGALIGTQLAGWLPARVLKRLFSVFLVVVAGRMLWSTFKPTSPPTASPVLATAETPSAPTERRDAP